MASYPELHLFIEDRPLGEYVANVRLHIGPYGEGESVDTQLDLAGLRMARQHIDNAIDGITRRQVVDAICGDCDLCGNTRMVQHQRQGYSRSELIHCPTCRPKIDAAREKGF